MSEGGLQGCKPPFSFPIFSIRDGLLSRVIYTKADWRTWLEAVSDCSKIRRVYSGLFSNLSLHIREYSGLVASKRQLWLIMPLPKWETKFSKR